ncbi:SDR family NAD(P)-dependent oxidoreductase [Agromyces protaetiae]|uniref:SDR family NAD(P)-dependent oxidoreductase n=1 Tax=Agromyces protaetiae TaxID=2509455 RepID=A0A4P6FGH7_9MICO|nr:SDR family NAD(P)-dependent oxidoreductase [Agromyces protaetiae]
MRAGTVVVTGATSGIGLETARILARTARRLVVQGPEAPEAVAGALARIGDGPAEVVYVRCDYARLQDVSDAAATIAHEAGGPIDGLVNNAGVPGAEVRRVTDDGHERTLQIDYLAMALLTEWLLGSLADGARIVNLASATHEMASLDLPNLELERGYDPVRAYARSKLAIILFTRSLQRRLPREITAVSLQPGVISTDLLHAMFASRGASVESGAENVVAALSADASGGEYFDERRVAAPSAEARDDALAAALAEWTAAALTPYLPAR